MSNKNISPLVDLLKTLAHPARLRTLALLREAAIAIAPPRMEP
jgi:DNA-binding transcriptional ArsR family regulator